MIKELFAYLSKRSASTLIFVFCVFWIVCHSQGFAVMIFTDQDLIFEKYGLLKNEYLNRYFFGNICSGDFWVRLIAPFFLTWLYVWKLPKWIINPAYKVQIHNRVERDLIKEKAYQKYVRIQRETAKEELATVKGQAKVIEENKKLEEADPEKKWRREYDDFINSNGRAGVLDQLYGLMYKHGGFIRQDWISSNSLMLCDTHGLIEINGDRQCSITEKGKAFLKYFSTQK